MPTVDAWGLVCDPGVDDAFALATLAGLGAEPSHVVAIPGNVDAVTAERNAAGLVELLGLDAAVWTVSGLEHQPARVGGGWHGDDGLGGQAGRLPAAAAPVVAAAGGLPASLLVTGPLSAVHLALRAGQSFERLMWMGGGPASEFNAARDPVATRAVFSACGAVLTQVPLDVTTRVGLTMDHLEHLWAGGAVAQLLAAAVEGRVRDGHGHGHGHVHDAVAAAAWLRPGLFSWNGGPQGSTVAVDVDADAVLDLIIAGVLACG